MIYCNRLPEAAGYLPCHRQRYHAGPCAHDRSATFHYFPTPPKRQPFVLVVGAWALLSLLGAAALGLLLTAARLIWEGK